MAATSVRRRITVRGRVQGVFFRDSTREQAQRHDLAGWVRNCGDGTVEVVVEGAPESVERLVAFCRDGPPRADVDEVEVHEEPPEGLQGFEVR
jgi:acylphosphatase